MNRADASTRASRTSGAGAGALPAAALAVAAAAPPTLLFWRSDLNDGRSPRGEAPPLDGDASSLLDMAKGFEQRAPIIVAAEEEVDAGRI